jgi:hypothetical protein
MVQFLAGQPAANVPNGDPAKIDKRRLICRDAGGQRNWQPNGGMLAF